MNDLTPRERQVLDTFLVDGCCDKDIADRLGMSLLNVRRRMSTIILKRGVESRAELAVKELRGETMTGQWIPIGDGMGMEVGNRYMLYVDAVNSINVLGDGSVELIRCDGSGAQTQGWTHYQLVSVPDGANG